MIDSTGIVARARVIVLALTLGVLAFAALGEFIGARTGPRALVAPAALAGVVSPVIGYRLYHWLQERGRTSATVEARCAAYLRATVVAVAVTEGVALFGVVAYLLSGEIAALIGVVTHVVLAGALWPTPEKLTSFTSGAEASPPRA